MAKHPHNQHKTNDDSEVTAQDTPTPQVNPSAPVGAVRYGSPIGVDMAGNVWLSQPPRHGSGLIFVATVAWPTV